MYVTFLNVLFCYNNVTNGSERMVYMSEMIPMKCGCEFENGQAVADKVRMKGFADRKCLQPATIHCSCGEDLYKNKTDRSIVQIVR